MKEYDFLPFENLAVLAVQMATFGAGLGAIVYIIGAFPFILCGLPGRSTLKKIANNRRNLMKETGSYLITAAEYVGGHPLLPTSGTRVLSLSETSLSIYSIAKTHRAGPLGIGKVIRWSIVQDMEIPLKNIIKTFTGRPKTAHEVYDEYGTTIDVFEHSPFLNIVLEEKEQTFQVSFQAFDSYTVFDLVESSTLTEKILSVWGLSDLKQQTPNDWHNLIISLKYKNEN